MIKALSFHFVCLLVIVLFTQKVCSIIEEFSAKFMCFLVEIFNLVKVSNEKVVEYKESRLIQTNSSTSSKSILKVFSLVTGLMNRSMSYFSTPSKHSSICKAVSALTSERVFIKVNCCGGCCLLLFCPSLPILFFACRRLCMCTRLVTMLWKESSKWNSDLLQIQAALTCRKSASALSPPSSARQSTNRQSYEDTLAVDSAHCLPHRRVPQTRWCQSPPSSTSATPPSSLLADSPLAW